MNIQAVQQIWWLARQHYPYLRSCHITHFHTTWLKYISRSYNFSIKCGFWRKIWRQDDNTQNSIISLKTISLLIFVKWCKYLFFSSCYFKLQHIIFIILSFFIIIAIFQKNKKMGFARRWDILQKLLLQVFVRKYSN